MTRVQLLHLLIRQARANGFQFRRWFTAQLSLPWTNTEKALEVLASGKRYYALLFSHDFAKTFWTADGKITFLVPQQTFQRTRPDGSIGTVTRKAYTRHSSRKDVWKYHLKELALVEEPLRYMRRYLRVEEELDGEDQAP